MAPRRRQLGFDADRGGSKDDRRDFSNGGYGSGSGKVSSPEWALPAYYKIRNKAAELEAKLAERERKNAIADVLNPPWWNKAWSR